MVQPQSVIGSLYWCAKFGWKLLVSITWKLEYFVWLAWKCLFALTKLGFLGDLTSKCGDISTELPKDTSVRGRTSYDPWIVKIGLPVQPVRMTKRPKKTKETLQWQTDYSPSRPMSSGLNMVWQFGALWAVSSYIKMWWFRIGVSGWMFLLVPAHPSSPGQRAIKRL